MYWTNAIHANNQINGSLRSVFEEYGGLSTEPRFSMVTAFSLYSTMPDGTCASSADCRRVRRARIGPFTVDFS